MKFMKKIIPKPIQLYLINLYNFFTKRKTDKEIIAIRKSHKIILEGLRNKKSLKVIFLVLHSSVWKYEELYNLFKKDKKFSPQVIIIPVVKSKEIDWENYYRTLNYFIRSDYNCVGTYNEIDKTWMNVKKISNPDIVFFTNPHKLTFDKYYIDEFKDKLTCYSSYAFVVIHLIALHYNQKIHKVLWNYFLETNTHHQYLKSFNKNINLPSNGFVTGFPGLDIIFNEKYKSKIVWKNYLECKTYKLIWAPHHSISGQDSGLNYSSFITYHQYFIELLEIKKNLQLAFKPHPLLKDKLYKDKEWGKKRTDEYYNNWNTLVNGQLEEGEYIDLFLESDAMILDSASFIVEYLYFNKPIIFTVKDEFIKERFNSFGKKVFDHLYTAKSEDQISSFITNQVMKNNDWKKKNRNIFLEQEVLPTNGTTASQNIYNKIKNELY